MPFLTAPALPETTEQIESFSQRLSAAKDAIQALLTQTKDDSRPVDLELPIGRLTRIDAIQMQAMAQMNRHQLDIRRQQVDVAMAALSAGNYGLCRSCKEPIGLERLDVIITVTASAFAKVDVVNVVLSVPTLPPLTCH